MAVVGMGITIGGVATDNNLMTAIGLTMVAIPALISGDLAIWGTAGALSTGVGIGTMAAGGFTGVFAGAEYQEAFTGQNFILDSGVISEGWYNTLMLTTAGLATLGTIASSTVYSLQINKILEAGKIRGVKATKGYPGVRFVDNFNHIRSLEFHTPHDGHGIHLQLNNWWLNHPQHTGKYYRAFAKHFEIFKFWKGWF